MIDDMPSVFKIADDILITGFDEQGRDYHARLDKVLRTCRQADINSTKITVFSDEPAFHLLMKSSPSKV